MLQRLRPHQLYNTIADMMMTAETTRSFLMIIFATDMKFKNF